MKVISKIFSYIFNPIASALGVKAPESIAKTFTKRPYLIWVLALIITACIILVMYRSYIFS